MSSISPVTSTTPTATPATTSSTPALTQADFLKLMVAQFTNQDPLASDSSGGSGGGGSSSTDYVNELMSMTNLTTMQNMSSQQALMASSLLPGSTVQVQASDGTTVTGQVQSVAISNGAIELTVNGKQYASSALLGITQTEEQAAAAATASSTATTN